MAHQSRDRERNPQGAEQMGAYHLHDGNERGDDHDLQPWWFCLQPLVFIRGRNQSLSCGGSRGAMIALHRIMFGFIITAAFFKGAVDAGRADLLRELTADRYLTMSISELMNVYVGS